MIKYNQTTTNTQKQSQHQQHNFEDLDTLHMGVAEPLSSEDIEKEIISKPIETSTQKDGISTWILLSGGQNSKILPTTVETPTKTSIRYESKIERVTKVKSSTTIKPKFKPTISLISKIDDRKTVELMDSNKSKVNQQIRPKKSSTTTLQPDMITKKVTNKKFTTSTKSSVSTSTSTTPTTPVPSTTEISSPTTDELFIEPSATTDESTTFLILEPKDADFDLPQDRSPGTTKKPKKTKNKKNKTKTDAKKPSKTQIANKDKPLSTKIYNYLAREVMPTVGVGLVGLTVAAGLATYFLAPFGALRRSYDDAGDRKDDMYYYNNEEYAGPDGQLEEEAFGKVIAGMPINSPYRNNIRYTVNQQQQQPSSQQQLRQPTNQIQNSRPGAKYVHYPSGQSPQYRVRNVAPANYPSVVQQQYNSYQQQNHQSNPVYTKRRDQYPQQFYRYSEEPSMGMYRKNSNYDFVQQQQQQQQQEQQKPIQTSQPIQVDAQKSNDKIYDIDNSYNPTIVTAEPYFDNTMSGTDMKIMDDNVLSKRKQFVVGTTTVDDEEKQQQQKQQQLQEQLSQSLANEEIIKETVDVIPEHGPRRRRRDTMSDESENEISGILGDDVPYTTPSTTLKPLPTMTLSLEKLDNMNNKESITKKPIKNTNNISTKPGFVELIKDLVEVKFRMGLSFLQRTTITLQKYLRSFEKRIDETKNKFLEQKNN